MGRSECLFVCLVVSVLALDLRGVLGANRNAVCVAMMIWGDVT